MEPLTRSGDDQLPRLPSKGEVIAGKYRVESIVGSGGMGVILAAKHLQLGQAVAIKLLRVPEAQRELATTRFLSEGRVAASLQSDHVVRIHDVGTLEDGTAYMVMELLRGKDLAVVLRERGPQPIELAVEYVLQAGEAIAEAHARGVVHRDLKPANLFLGKRSDGSPMVKVLDFGISKVLRSTDPDFNANLTSTRSVMGSPAYMAPEQVRDGKHVDHRLDIWGLGVILYELIAGVPSFTGESLLSVCAAIVADPPRPLDLLRPDCPAELLAVIGRCLEKNPADRYESVNELLGALRPFAARSDTRWQAQELILTTPDFRPPTERVSGVELVSPSLMGGGHPTRPEVPPAAPNQLDTAPSQRRPLPSLGPTLLDRRLPSIEEFPREATTAIASTTPVAPLGKGRSWAWPVFLSAAAFSAVLVWALLRTPVAPLPAAAVGPVGPPDGRAAPSATEAVAQAALLPPAVAPQLPPIPEVKAAPSSSTQAKPVPARVVASSPAARSPAAAASSRSAATPGSDIWMER